MSPVSRVSLDDTLHLLQLVRETALERNRRVSGEQAGEVSSQLAQKLTPVVERIKELRASSVRNEPAAGILGQADFQRLLAAARAESGTDAARLHARTQEAFGARAAQTTSASQTELTAPAFIARTPAANTVRPVSVEPAMNLSSTLERNRMILAMAAGKMDEIEIARQFGMSREEVRLVLNTRQSRGTEVR